MFYQTGIVTKGVIKLNTANKDNHCCRCGKGFIKKSNSQKRCYKCREEIRKETNNKRYAGITKKELEALKNCEPEGSSYVITKLYKPYGAELFA
jgi:hypothetical protein